MAFLMLKDVPRYDCLKQAAERFPDLDPSACEVFLQLLRTGDELATGQQAYLGQHNLSQGRFTVMMLLTQSAAGGTCPTDSQSCSPAALAGRAGVTRATMTGLIDTLERDGYVTRQPDPGDRRMMSVHLTPQGEAVMQAVLPGYFRRIAHLMENLSDAERQTFVRLLNKVVQRAAAMTSPATAAS